VERRRHTAKGKPNGALDSVVGIRSADRHFFDRSAVIYRVNSASHLLFGILAGVVFSAAQESPGLAIRPVIYAMDEEAARAMKSAPVILLAEVAEVTPTGDARLVEKPPEVGGPMTPTIPLHLARIRAKVWLTIRGPVRTSVEFYSWVWASGKHGGPRLFNPVPGSSHVIFLRQDGGYLHTVGDYPSYDIEVRSRLVPALLSAWHSSHESAGDPLTRLIASRFRAEFDNLSAAQLHAEFSSHSTIPKEYYLRDLPDLVRLAGPFFVVTQLDNICRESTNRFGRIAACTVTGREFPGRCLAYRLAEEAGPEEIESSFATGVFSSCEAQTKALIRDLRSDDLPLRGFYGWNMTAEHRREAMRVYASAMDSEFHRAACEVAARMPEARDIEECSVARQR
jgi:hypothetical protein